MTTVALILVAAPIALFVYAYVAYPALLWVLTARRQRTAPAVPAADDWPHLSITVPAYNAELTIAVTLDSILAANYPADRREIIVISDASTDHTDAIVRTYAGRGVTLMRQPRRAGKTAAENAVLKAVHSEFVVNIDAAVRIRPDALKVLVRAFSDPTVGVASGRDISTGEAMSEGTGSESGYVGYEMWVRSLETRLGSIIGASGCFYGFRKAVHSEGLPDDLSWDFASPLFARRLGYRSVSAEGAFCIVPRTPSLRTEMRRKARTMARGLETLWHMSALMNPLRYGRFAFMLISHKLCRWLVYPLAPLALVGLAILSADSSLALAGLVIALAGITAGIIALQWPGTRSVPRLMALAGYAVASLGAGVLAWVQGLRRQRTPTWEPTPRANAAVS